MDWSLCVDPIRCAEYMAKYTARTETISETAQTIMNQVLKLHIEDDTLKVTPLRFLQSIFMKLQGSRDYGAYEVAHHNLGLPMVTTSIKFELVSLLSSRTINLHKLRQYQKNHKDSNIIYKTLIDFYANRFLLKERFPTV